MYPLLKNKKILKKKRKELRNHSTSAEAELWCHLKSRQLDGRKFRRQFSVGNFILDFYCPEEKLCIELDGQDHFSEEGKAKDEMRDRILRQAGIRTLRFENGCVWINVEEVLKEIKSNFRK